MKAKKLTAKLRKLLDEFDTNAQYHGWINETGSGREVKNAMDLYAESKKELEDELLRLQNEVRKLKALNAELRDMQY